MKSYTYFEILRVLQKILKFSKSRARGAVFNLAPNFIIDTILRIKSVPFTSLQSLKTINVDKTYLTTGSLREFLRDVYPDWGKHFSDVHHKKLVELFISYSLLNLKESDTYLDVAGGLYTYAFFAKCKKRYLHDLKLNDGLKELATVCGVLTLESTAASIPLPSESVDKISCHHSFEHFEENVDVQCIHEIQRLLKPGGLCCILPIFISDQYLEIVDSLRWHKSDPAAKLICDPTSPFPGGDFSGGFARIYNLDKFQARLIDNINKNLYKVRLVEAHLDNKPVPDLQLRCNKIVSKINFPYRALLIQKHAD